MFIQVSLSGGALISEAARVREPEKSFSIAPSRIAKNIRKIRMKMDPSIHTDLVLYSGMVLPYADIEIVIWAESEKTISAVIECHGVVE